jgi:hypothetical protein
VTRHELADEPQDLLLARAQNGEGIGYHTLVWYRVMRWKSAAMFSGSKAFA